MQRQRRASSLDSPYECDANCDRPRRAMQAGRILPDAELTVECGLRRLDRLLAEARQTERGNVETRAAREREVGTQQAADRAEAEAVPRKPGGDDETRDGLRSVDHRQRVRR